MGIGASAPEAVQPDAPSKKVASSSPSDATITGGRKKGRGRSQRKGRGHSKSRGRSQRKGRGHSKSHSRSHSRSQRKGRGRGRGRSHRSH